MFNNAFSCTDKVRCINKQAFCEDVSSPLIAAKLAAINEVDIDDATLSMCRDVDLSKISKGRVHNILIEVLLNARKPSLFFNQVQLINEKTTLFFERGFSCRPSMIAINNAALQRDKVEFPFGFMMAALYEDSIPREFQEGKRSVYIKVKKTLRSLACSKYLCAYVAELLFYKSQIVNHGIHFFENSVFPNDVIVFNSIEKIAETSSFSYMDYKYIFENYKRYQSIKEQFLKISGDDLIAANVKPSAAFPTLLYQARFLTHLNMSKENAIAFAIEWNKHKNTIFGKKEKLIDITFKSSRKDTFLYKKYSELMYCEKFTTFAQYRDFVRAVPDDVGMKYMDLRWFWENPDHSEVTGDNVLRESVFFVRKIYHSLEETLNFSLWENIEKREAEKYWLSSDYKVALALALKKITSNVHSKKEIETLTKEIQEVLLILPKKTEAIAYFEKRKYGDKNVLPTVAFFERINAQMLADGCDFPWDLSAWNFAARFIKTKATGTRILAKETSKTVVKEKKKLSVFEIKRVGKDYRGGTNATVSQLASDFNIKVDFGNSITKKEQQAFLNYLYDSLMDLKCVIGIPINVCSNLCVAFGARGNSQSLAFYCCGDNEISLKRRGSFGSFAHEWLHAMVKGHNQFVKKFAENFKETEYEKYSIEKDKQYREKHKYCKRKVYYAVPEEMLARAFDCYVYEKLKKNKIKNGFLCENQARREGYKELFPQGKDLAAVTDLLNNWIVQTNQTTRPR